MLGLIKKIEDICKEHLDNTEINNILLCEDSHDHYLLAKVDMAKEILKEINLAEKHNGGNK
tara:strand:+ start:420 stop:602 length:183 start_codon:yes stop_codon:yes gene_type:complete